MEGVTFITDEVLKKRFVQIDLEHLEKHPNEVEDLLDIIIAESRTDEESIPLDQVIKELKAEGKLDADI